MKLDGTETPKPTPFDAHEQATRVPHTFSKEEGYKADPEFKASEYPKAIAHDEETGEPVIAKDEDHEAELLETLEEGK
jgi:hypothetical protein